VNVLLPVIPLRDVSLFPEASLTISLTQPAVLRAVEMATRTGNRVLALAQKEEAAGPRDLHAVGTLAQIARYEDHGTEGVRVELDGLQRARAVTLVGVDGLVAETETLEDGDAGDDWGSAVEALARYLHAHAELRTFLDQQRRSREPMAWVNLACQHLPITASARQRLLESMAAERCVKISRGLDALLRKEQGA
jgi:ATP-dependent Lon protease